MRFKNILNVMLVAIMLSACTSPYRSIADADNTSINLIPMYGYPNIEKTEQQKKADEVFIKSFSSSTGSREKASKEFTGRGWYYLQQSDRATSMRRFNQSWLLDPDYHMPYWGFGVLLNTQGKAAEAAPHFDKALSLIDDNDSDKPRLLVDAAKAYMAQGNNNITTDKVKSEEFFEKANSLANEVFKLDPKFGNEALKLDPQFADAYRFPQLRRDAALTSLDSLKFIGTDDSPKSTGEPAEATGIPVSAMDYVLKFRGFSIQQPTDNRWRLHSDNQEPHIASFYFAPLSPTHSFNATVQIRGLPADFATKPEFKEFVDTKLRENSSRFEELSFISTLTELSGEWAVNYELRYLDKHPVNSSTPLFMTIKGFMYLHPYWKKSVIDAFYSERGTAAELDGTLDPVGQELIDGTSPEKS